MNYENIPCPVCGSHMHQGDDIVICPDCGTPCHRECWKETGHCINEDKHGTDFKWTPPEKHSLFDSAEKPEASSYIPVVTENDTIFCPLCGSENPTTSKFCNHCRAPLKSIGEDSDGGRHCPVCNESLKSNDVMCPRCGTSVMIQAPVNIRTYNPTPYFNPENPDEEISGMKVGELSGYLRKNVTKYLNKFRNIESGKLTFNWAAFFFGPLWFCFRKMFALSVGIIFAMCSISLIAVPSEEEALKIMNSYTDEISYYNSIIKGETPTTTLAETESATESTVAESETSTESTVAENETSTESTVAENETSTENVAAENETSTESTTAVATTISKEEATNKSYELQLEMYTKMVQVMRKPFMIFIAMLFALNLALAFFADSLYFNKIKRDFATVKGEIGESRIQMMLLSRRGGTSILNVICAFFLYQVVSSIVLSIADWIANSL